MMGPLRVYLHNHPIGLLEQDDEDIFSFRYDEAWLQSTGAYPLSRMLPLEAKPFAGKTVRAFFAGIFPEEGPRRRIEQILGISAGNDFTLLGRIGGECAGAVSVLPEHMTLQKTGKPPRELTEQELSANAAMKIDGSDSINAFNSGGWRKMAEKAGVSWPLLKDRMQSISLDVLGQVDAIELPASSPDNIPVQIVSDRAERVLTMVEK